MDQTALISNKMDSLETFVSDILTVTFNGDLKYMFLIRINVLHCVYFILYPMHYLYSKILWFQHDLTEKDVSWYEW